MLILLLLVLGSLAVLKVIIRTSGPMYQAHSLSHWLEVNASEEVLDEERVEAQNAVLAIGTNALPYLLKDIRRERPTWRTAIHRKASIGIRTNALFAGFFNNEGRIASEAMMGFGILGSNANAAIPELTILFNNTNSRRTSQRAMGALSMIGGEAFPILTNALADTNRPNRSSLLYHIGWMAVSNGTNTVLPTLVSSLNDHDPLVQNAAKRLLLRLAPETITNQPVEHLETNP